MPILAALLLWCVLGLRGLSAALTDGRQWWLIGLGLLTFWALLSPSWARFGTQSGEAAAQFLVVVTFALMLTAVDFPPRYAAYAFGTGLIVQGLIVILQMHLQGSVGVWGLGEFNLYPTRRDLSVVVADGIRLIRPYGLQAHPNIAGGYLAIGLLVLAGGVFTEVRGKLPMIGAAVLSLGFWAMLLTFSRGAWLSFAIGLLTLAILTWHARLWRRESLQRALAVLLIMSGIGLLFVVGYGSFLLARAGINSGETEQISVAQRGVFMGIAHDLILRHPTGGTGIGTFAWEAADMLRRLPYRGLRGENVHNVPLLITSELGVLGLLGWLLMHITWVAYIWRKVRDPYALGLAAAAVALLVIGLVDHYPFGMYHGLIMSFGCMAAACYPASRHV
ncbi:MAG: hypothetical protein OHK0023_17260 [Anaerolineae bacterium]